MAPIKFEEKIKDKLEKRTINPSKDSWAKLSSKLDEQDGKSTGKIVWWIGIAASLVGVLLVTTLFFNNAEDETIVPIIVKTPIKETIKQQEEKNSVKDIVVENEKPSFKEKKVQSKKAEKHNIIQSNVKEISNNSNVVVNATNEEEIIKNQDLIHPNTLLTEKNKKEIVAQVLESEESKHQVSDSEIEALLEGARKELLTNSIQIEQSKTVDAKSLLQDVESDLNETFREKVFKTLISGYNSVRTAVAERND